VSAETLIALSFRAPRATSGLGSRIRSRIEEAHRYQEAYTVALSSDGRRACGALSEKLIVWDLDTGRIVQKLSDPAGIEHVALDADGRWCITSFVYAPFLRLWDLQEERVVLTLRGHTLQVDSLAISADGRRAVSAAGDQTLRIWDLNLKPVSRDHWHHDAPVGAVATSTDGKRVVSASE